MRNIKLVIEYDGTNYVGWQDQPNGPSIQREVESALAQMLQEPVTTVAAGRTDAGVHARGQVVTCRIRSDDSLPSLLKGLNALLPPDIRVQSVEQVPESFHARTSARTRVYRYFLNLRQTALLRNYGWYVGGYQLDTNLLDACARQILGKHDFTSFCKSNSDATYFDCTIEKAAWTQDGPNLIFEIRADHFLYGMVRTLVGTMVEIARGHRRFEEFEEILLATDRARAGMAAPAKGLFLEEIIY
jgi:tRNA pseudouridine38-40 synthase